jgi:hypothetical protein
MLTLLFLYYNECDRRFRTAESLIVGENIDERRLFLVIRSPGIGFGLTCRASFKV